MARTRSIKCPRCHGVGARKQRVALMDRGVTTTEIVDCLTCDGEGRLGPVITSPDESGGCPCCAQPDADHVCVMRGPVLMPRRASLCVTHRRYLAQ